VLNILGLVFIVFAAVLLVVPVVLAARELQPWQRVFGLWIAGWGFLLMGLGTRMAEQGWGGLVVPGVIVTTVGHLLQRRATRPVP